LSQFESYFEETEQLKHHKSSNSIDLEKINALEYAKEEARKIVDKKERQRALSKIYYALKTTEQIQDQIKKRTTTKE